MKHQAVKFFTGYDMQGIYTALNEFKNNFKDQYHQF